MNDDRYYKADFKDLSYYPILHTKFNKNFTCSTAFKTSSQQGAEKLQNQIYNNKIGLLETKNKEKINVLNSRVWGHTFTNSSNSEQTFSTQAYEKTITKTSTWTISVSLKESLKFDFFVGEGSVEFTVTGGYTNTKTETETLKLPSQNFKIKPNSVADVNVILEKATYKSTGIVKFEVDMSKELDFGPYTSKCNNIEEKHTTSILTVKEFIDILWKHNYDDYLKHNDNNTNSIFTVDNIENPTRAYFNIPITWDWSGNNLIVNFTN